MKFHLHYLWVGEILQIFLHTYVYTYREYRDI